jgi:hypothetical protein
MLVLVYMMSCDVGEALLAQALAHALRLRLRLGKLAKRSAGTLHE